MALYVVVETSRLCPGSSERALLAGAVRGLAAP